MADILDKKTPEGKGFRTFYQAVFGTVVAFLVGLWSLPGVPEYVTNFVRTEGVSLILVVGGLIGIPAGLLAYWQNRKGK